MKLNCIIYTTTRSASQLKALQNDLDFVRSCLLKTPGREGVNFALVRIRPPAKVLVSENEDGKMRIDWNWFHQQFRVATPPSANAVGFHFTPAERKAWGISRDLGGLYHRDGDDVIDFWICAAPRAQSSRYPFSEFARIVLHELLHGDVHWTSADRNLVHEADYLHNRIHELPADLSYTRWNSLVALKNLITSFITNKKSNMKTLLQVCKDHLGTDVTPDDLVPDMVACAITVSTLINKTDATFPKVAGTWTLYDILEHRKDYERITTPIPGAIIISPTATGNGSMPGHVGIVSDTGKIMSNDSYTGKFVENFTMDSWRARYVDKGGFPIYIYRKK